MTKRMLSVLSVMSLVAMLVPLSVRIGASEVNCRIPFSFSVSGRPMPAGLYRSRRWVPPAWPSAAAITAPS